MVESDSYGRDHFRIHYPVGISIGLSGWNFAHLCKENLRLDTIELYEEPIVLFTDVLCNISYMPRTTATQKKRCKPWFNT